MARRKIEEINAGSMADIAFLLLIFFLVTTTMEVDAGIARQLPLKLDNPIPPDDLPDVIKRDVFEISTNSRDEILVEEKPIELNELEEIVREFYMANIRGIDENPNMPMYFTINTSICAHKITEIQNRLQKSPSDRYWQGELSKWQTNLALCQEMPGGEYMEMKKSALVRFENQAGTSYGLYLQIQNILKKVVNELRAAKCDEMGWGDYYALREDREEDQDVIKKLRVLVPERIIESKIER